MRKVFSIQNCRSLINSQLRFNCGYGIGGFQGIPHIPAPYNEPLRNYEKGSKERHDLLDACKEFKTKTVEIPCIINGKPIFTGKTMKQLMPANHSHVIANVHLASKDMIKEAIEGTLKAREKWGELPYYDRASVFLKAADLLASTWRNKILASTMIGQSKTLWQAEIDAACETIDFLRFNVSYAEKLYTQQPTVHSRGVWNRVEYRPLEGFIAAVSPFNFTAIGANLATTPALLGNGVIWKPSKGAVMSNYIIYEVLKESGLPDGVIQFVPSNRADFAAGVFGDPHLAGLAFTGSTSAFINIWEDIASNLKNMKTFPRISGETGGKNFILLHPSSNLESAINNIIRGAFEYSGQKCSATARAYIPKSVWQKIKDPLLKEVAKLKTGLPDDPSSFLSSVIDETAFNNISGFIERAKKDTATCEILCGGGCDKSKGYFIEPTIILTKNPQSETMTQEIFGPVLTVYVFEDSLIEDEIFKLIDSTSSYALTGSIYGKDRLWLTKAIAKLRNAAGNFYVNDKSTGAVVGQQPFGGARCSGTNDKAGSEMILSRWVSVRTVKENFLDTLTWSYPSVDL
jgi:1-pyrroline-5-carboxylate dehydrogenase